MNQEATKSIMPNFIMFAAMRSGTSSIYKYLEQHPDILMSSLKEPGFFICEADKNIFTQEIIENFTVITELEAYQKLFEHYKVEKAIGEATILYIYYEKCAAIIKKYIPDVKLIAVLRNPADRAFSHYIWGRRDGLENLNQFQDALLVEDERIKAKSSFLYNYKDMGFYYRQIQHYYKIFDPAQIKICLYENFMANPTVFMQDIFEFLEVDSSFTPDLSQKYNPSLIPRNNSWNDFIRKPNPIKSIIKPLIPSKLRQKAKKKAKLNNLYKPEFKPEVRQQLMSEYKEDIIKLQELTQQDFSIWM